MHDPERENGNPRSPGHKPGRVVWWIVGGVVLLVGAAWVLAPYVFGLPIALVHWVMAARTVPTVPGPEEPSVLARLRGTVIYDTPGGGIEGVTLPDKRLLRLREPRNSSEPGAAAVHTLAGPDERGTIAYVLIRKSPKRPWAESHQLVVQRPGAPEKVVFDRGGDPTWDNVASDCMALSHRDERVAIAVDLKKAQMPGALLMEGPLEVWDLKSGASRRYCITALEGPLSWFPDGRYLAYSELVSRSAAPEFPLAPDNFGAEIRKWSRVPVTFILDTKTGEKRMLHLGEGPVVSMDGKYVAVSLYEAGYRLVDAATGRSKPIPKATSLVALLDGKTAIFIDYPTRGKASGYTQSNSPIGPGPRPMLAAKAGALEGRHFATIVDSVDPRLEMSFGPGIPVPPPMDSGQPKSGEDEVPEKDP